MREPGVFDRFRFAPADDRSRELRGGDSAGEVGFGTLAMNAARGDCGSFRGDRAGDSRLFREEKALSAMCSGDVDAAGSGDLLEAHASSAPSAPAVSVGGVLGLSLIHI